jgi:hypothetical protein
MLILENIFQYSFIFNVKFFFEKKNKKNNLVLFFWNYFMPNLLVGYGTPATYIERKIPKKILKPRPLQLIMNFPTK